MVRYTIEIPGDFDAELQREVARFNRTKAPETDAVDALGLLTRWCRERLLALQRETQERLHELRDQAYRDASPAVQAQIDALLNRPPG